MLRLFSDPMQSESIFRKVHFNSNFSSKRYDKIWKIKKPFSLRPEHIRKHLLFQHIIQMLQSVLEQEIFSNWIYHQHLVRAGCRPFKELINILWILELKLNRLIIGSLTVKLTSSYGGHTIKNSFLVRNQNEWKILGKIIPEN